MSETYTDLSEGLADALHISAYFNLFSIEFYSNMSG